MTTHTHTHIARSDIVGSLLRPDYLRPLEWLAVSPQCGFASGEAGNPLTPAQQTAKLHLVAQVARRVWST
jgi:5-methyltetrahydropteroyltriglutamate--homocysteine methyltransferase